MVVSAAGGGGARAVVGFEETATADVTELSILASIPAILALCLFIGLPMKASEVSSRSFGLGFSLGVPAFAAMEFGELEVGESEDLR